MLDDATFYDSEINKIVNIEQTERLAQVELDRCARMALEEQDCYDSFTTLGLDDEQIMQACTVQIEDSFKCFLPWLVPTKLYWEFRDCEAEEEIDFLNNVRNPKDCTALRDKLVAETESRHDKLMGNIPPVPQKGSITVNNGEEDRLISIIPKMRDKAQKRMGRTQLRDRYEAYKSEYDSLGVMMRIGSALCPDELSDLDKCLGIHNYQMHECQYENDAFTLCNSINNMIATAIQGETSDQALFKELSPSDDRILDPFDSSSGDGILMPFEEQKRIYYEDMLGYSRDEIPGGINEALLPKKVEKAAIEELIEEKEKQAKRVSHYGGSGNPRHSGFDGPADIKSVKIKEPFIEVYDDDD